MPLNVPTAAPRTTSLAQCALLYIRESPTSVAPPYITGATIQVLMRPPPLRLARHHRRRRERRGRVARRKRPVAVALVKAAEPAKSCGFVSADTYGRARPAMSLVQRRDDADEYDRLGAVQAEIGDVLPVSDATDAIHAERR